MTRWCLCCVIALFVQSSSAIAADRVVFVQPGPEGEDSAPYGFLPQLARGNATTLYAFTEDDGHVFETYLRFAIPSDLLAPGEIVKAAEFWITYAFDFTAFGETSDEPGTLEVRPVQDGWSETGLTYATRPLVGAPIATLMNVTSYQTLRFDVTATARGWVQGATNHGLAITSPTRRVMGFHSFEATSQSPAARPLLLFTVGPGGGADADLDGIADAADNCPYAANAGQEDSGGLGTTGGPDGTGDACQCGDVTGDGRVTNADAVVILRSLLVPPLATMPHPERCDVGGSAGCTNADVVLVRRALLMPATASIAAQCPAAAP